MRADPTFGSVENLEGNLARNGLWIRGGTWAWLPGIRRPEKYTARPKSDEDYDEWEEPRESDGEEAEGSFYIYRYIDIRVQESDAELQWFDPLKDSPDLYLRFAELRSDLWQPSHEPPLLEQLDRLMQFAERYGPPDISHRSEDMCGLFRELPEPPEEDEYFLHWSTNPTRNSYGAIRHAADFESKQKIMAAASLWGYKHILQGILPRTYGFDYEMAIHDAAFLAIAVRCLQSLEDWSRYQPGLKALLQSRKGDQLFEYMAVMLDHEGGLASLEFAPPSYELDSEEGVLGFLERLLNNHPSALPSVYDQSRYDRSTKRWLRTKRFHSLVDLMWFQLNERLHSGDPIRECLGCGILFQPGRQNQYYHDALCRGRANAKSTYQRNKGS